MERTIIRAFFLGLCIFFSWSLLAFKVLFEKGRTTQKESRLIFLVHMQMRLPYEACYIHTKSLIKAKKKEPHSEIFSAKLHFFCVFKITEEFFHEKSSVFEKRP